MKLKEYRKNDNLVILDNQMLINNNIPSDLGSEEKPLEFWSYDINHFQFVFDEVGYEQYKEKTNLV